MPEIEEVTEEEATQIKKTKKAVEEDDDEDNAPPASPMPSMKMSQIAPMVVMLGLQKINIEELGYIHHVEAMFVVVQVLCIAAQYWVYTKIQTAPEGKKLKIPEVKTMGQVVTPATEQSAKDYDMGKWKEAMKQAVMSGVITSGIYYKWQYVMPLVLQVLMTPLQLYESPLFECHVLGKDVTRPFATPNPFGLPSAPTPAAEEVKEVADKKEK